VNVLIVLGFHLEVQEVEADLLDVHQKVLQDFLQEALQEVPHEQVLGEAQDLVKNI